MKVKLAKAVIEASSACKEFKAAAQAYLDAAETENADTAWSALVAEAKEDICTIDNTIGFMESDMAKQIFGAELAEQKLAAAKEAKANGAVYCNCPGCAAAEAILKYAE